MKKQNDMRQSVTPKTLMPIALSFVIMTTGTPITLPVLAGSAVAATVVEEQKTETAPVEVEVPVAVEATPSVQDVLLDVCTDRGYDESCAKVLLGMLWKESTNVANAIGDAGKARGYFQIHYKLHRISLDCAYDLRCSAEWSLDYLERNGYPRYVNYAVQCHNGCNINNGYAASALRHGKRLWSQPLPIQVATTAK